MSLKITHIGSSITQAQWVSVSLNINHRVAHFKFVTRLIVMKTCVENHGSRAFRVVMRPGYRENWFFWIFKMLNKLREQSQFKPIKINKDHSFTFTNFLFLLLFLFNSPFLYFISFESVLHFFFCFFFILQRIRFQHSLTKE